MSARHYRSRLEVRSQAATRTRSWRKNGLADINEGLSDYRRNGVQR